VTETYAQVLRKLTALDDRAAADRAEAQRWHDDRVADAQDKVRAADETVREAERSVRDAQRALERVDAQANGLWADFVHRTGPVAERLGRGKPAAAVPRQRDRNAAEYLSEAETAVAYTPPARPLTSATTILFGLFGLLGGLAGVGAWALIRWAGDRAGGAGQSAGPVLALIVLLLGPVLAAVAARRVAQGRGVGLTGSAVATVLITGVLTAGLVVAAVQAAHGH
jgi:phage-related tail protein